MTQSTQPERVTATLELKFPNDMVKRLEELALQHNQSLTEYVRRTLARAVDGSGPKRNRRTTEEMLNDVYENLNAILLNSRNLIEESQARREVELRAKRSMKEIVQIICLLHEERLVENEKFIVLLAELNDEVGAFFRHFHLPNSYALHPHDAVGDFEDIRLMINNLCVTGSGRKRPCLRRRGTKPGAIRDN